MTWFILSLIAILFWSGSDLFSKLGSRPDDKYSHWKMVMAVGVVMGAHAFFLIATGTPFSISDIVTYLPASAMYILSMILGYAGLRYIELSISSPICNSSGAVAALLCFFILKETMSGLQFFAVALVCARQKAYPQLSGYSVPHPVLHHRRPGHLCGCAPAGYRHCRGAGEHRL